MYNILNFGAVTDGKTVCTAAIQHAIDECHNNGGGRVIIPTGEFVSGTLWLRDKVELHLEMGAVLRASGDLADYNAEDAYPQNFASANEGWWGKHLIVALECQNVAITGLGTLDGNSEAFVESPPRPPKHNTYGWRRGYVRERDPEMRRPGPMVCFVESRYITVKDVTMRNGTCWSCLFHGCEYVDARGIKVFNSPCALNTDGIDIDCCRFVTVSDCIIHTGDDALTVRCTAQFLKNKDMPSEYIAITNCTCSVSACGVRIGVGTGVIRHVRISNLTIEGAGTGIKYMTSYGGRGRAEIEDVNFSNVSIENVGFPIELLGDVGSIRHVTLDNIRARGMAGIRILGEGDCAMEDIALRNVDITVTPDVEMTESRRRLRGKYPICVHNVRGALLDGVRVFHEDDETDWEDVFDGSGSDLAVRNCNF